MALPRALAIILLLPLLSCAGPRPSVVDRAAALRNETLPPLFARLRPAALAKRPPAPGDWLSSHPEPGQSLAEFRRSTHRVPTSERGHIVLARLGNVTPQEERVIARCAPYLEAFFGTPVRFAANIDLARIPARAQRESRGFGLQLETRFVLDSLLARGRPPDAFVYLALSTLDLYPQPSWNFVFGQALPSEGVGVWSLARYGVARGTPESEPRLQRRTARTASHEIGHLLGLPHCIAWECLMNGSNTLEESDSRPLELCPPCMGKLCGSLGIDPAVRAARLADVLDEFGLAPEAAIERKLYDLIAAHAQN